MTVGADARAGPRTGRLPPQTSQLTVYRPRAIKRRSRRSKAEIQAICDAIYEVLKSDNPQSVRHVFYRLCSPPYDLVPKDEAGYNTIKRKLLDLRQSGDVPWGWVLR